jgi:hypothetical protein
MFSARTAFHIALSQKILIGIQILEEALHYSL